MHFWLLDTKGHFLYIQGVQRSMAKSLHADGEDRLRVSINHRHANQEVSILVVELGHVRLPIAVTVRVTVIVRARLKGNLAIKGLDIIREGKRRAAARQLAVGLEADAVPPSGAFGLVLESVHAQCS